MGGPLVRLGLKAGSLAMRRRHCQKQSPSGAPVPFQPAPEPFPAMSSSGQTAALRARRSGPLRGRVRAPGDKSVSHRALIFGALAQGVTEIEGLLEGEDVLRSAAAMRAFGAGVEALGDGRWRVTGRGGFAEPADVIDCGNAGTGVRLILGAASGFDLAATFTGDESLRGRPMNRVM